MLLAFMLILNVNGELEIVDFTLSGNDCVEKMIELQDTNLSCHFQKKML